MFTLVTAVDAAALGIIWWCSAAGLVAGHEASNWRRLVVSLGLAGTMVFAFCGALATVLQPGPVTWWGFGLRVAGAVVALGLYEYRFGVARHARMARCWVCHLPARAAALARPRDRGRPA